MRTSKIVDMLSDIVERLDYDMYRGIFVYPNLENFGEEYEEDEDSIALKSELIEIVRKHLKKDRK